MRERHTRIGRFLAGAVCAVLLCGMLLAGAVPAGAASETEPNDSFVTATNIAVNQTHAGVISTEWEDDDYYRFTLPEDGCISVSLNMVLAEGQYFLRVYSLTAEELGSYDCQGLLTQHETQQLGLAAGTYYLKISAGYGGLDGKTYSFQINYTPSDAWEKEPNDSFVTATNIALGRTYSGVVSVEWGDDDYYRFTLPENGYISTTLNMVLAEGRYFLRIYNQGMEELGSYDCEGMRTQHEMQPLGLAAGTYYLEIFAGYGGLDGKTYSFQIDFTASDAWEIEPNNAFVTATDIAVNRTYSGAINAGWDDDCYRFTLSEDGRVSVTLNNLLRSEDQYLLRLYDRDMEVLGSYDCDGVKTQYQTPPLALAAGTYYLEISAGYSGRGGKTYSFQINFGDLPGDLSGDGKVDSTDARMVLQYEVGLITLREAQKAVADVSHDEAIDSTDARLILQYEVGLITAL